MTQTRALQRWRAVAELGSKAAHVLDCGHHETSKLKGSDGIRQTPGKLFLGLRSPVLVVVLLVAPFIGYVVHAESSAVRKAEAFCRDTVNGSPVDRLKERAALAGAVDLNNPAAWGSAAANEIRWVRLPGGNEGLPVTFLGSAAHTKHYCLITARDGIVAYSEVKHLD